MQASSKGQSFKGDSAGCCRVRHVTPIYFKTTCRMSKYSFQKILLHYKTSFYPVLGLFLSFSHTKPALCRTYDNAFFTVSFFVYLHVTTCNIMYLHCTYLTLTLTLWYSVSTYCYILLQTLLHCT